MTVTPRASSRRSKRRRSSFVAPASRVGTVPDALSWREQLDGTTAPKGPEAWSAVSAAQQDRTVIDAGPYGVIDLAVMDAVADTGRNPQLGVVWWDKRSLREEEEDDDFGTVQTGFVPASITDHVSLAGVSGRIAAPPVRELQPHPVDVAIAGAALAATHAAPRHAHSHASVSPASVSPAFVSGDVRTAEPERIAPPVSAGRPAGLDDSGQQRHTRRSRHVALVPKKRGRRRRSGAASHPRRVMLRRRRTRRRVILGVIIVVIAFVATILVQSVFLTPFTVPSVSMQNTLQTDDRILVDKVGYGPSSIHRGDVVVFTDPGGWLTGAQASAPADTGDYLVKRVIGIPGDHVTCCSTDGRVTVNGREIVEQYAVVPSGRPAAASPFDVTVPAGALWVLGDNRYHSRDSSQTQALPSKGLVPIADVVGQAVLKVWPLTRLAPIGSAQDTFASVPDQACPI